MSVSFNLKGSDWAASQQQNCSGDAAEFWSKLELYSKKKLWHQMTQVILEFINSPHFKTSPLEFYTKFVAEFEQKMNKLSLIEVIKRAVNEIQDIAEAKAFLEKSQSKVSECVMSTILLKIIGGCVELKLTDNRKAVKEVIEEVEKELDGLGIVNAVHSRFYELASSFYQLEADHGNYYRNSLKYLGVADISRLTLEQKQTKAFSIGISALLAKDVYNMGELLQHDILNSLQDSKDAWLIHLLQAFNCGDIKTFKSTSAQWRSQPDLKAKETELLEKMCLMCLMEMTFVRPANDRAISFNEISEKTSLPKTDVESLVMRALSLDLVKGMIDEVDEKVHMTWVQPRVLNTEQIDRMRSRLDCWVKEVCDTEKLMETHAQPILTH